jgi:hypothetical protein
VAILLHLTTEACCTLSDVHIEMCFFQVKFVVIESEHCVFLVVRNSLKCIYASTILLSAFSAQYPKHFLLSQVMFPHLIILYHRVWQSLSFLAIDPNLSV